MSIDSKNNTGTQWNTDESRTVNIHIHKLVINDGKYSYTPSFAERIKFALGIGSQTQQGTEQFIERTFGVTKLEPVDEQSPDERGVK